MWTIIERAAIIVFAALSMVLISSAQTQNAATAPKPTQILVAKKVFVSNASGMSDEFYLSGPDEPYNKLYEGIKTWGRL